MKHRVAPYRFISFHFKLLLKCVLGFVFVINVSIPICGSETFIFSYTMTYLFYTNLMVQFSQQAKYFA